MDYHELPKLRGMDRRPKIHITPFGENRMELHEHNIKIVLLRYLFLPSFRLLVKSPSHSLQKLTNSKNCTDYHELPKLRGMDRRPKWTQITEWTGKKYLKLRGMKRWRVSEKCDVRNEAAWKIWGKRKLEGEIERRGHIKHREYLVKMHGTLWVLSETWVWEGMNLIQLNTTKRYTCCHCVGSIWSTWLKLILVSPV